MYFKYTVGSLLTNYKYRYIVRNGVKHTNPGYGSGTYEATNYQRCRTMVTRISNSKVIATSQSHVFFLPNVFPSFEELGEMI